MGIGFINLNNYGGSSCTGFTLMRGRTYRYLRTVSGTSPITLLDCIAAYYVSLSVYGNVAADTLKGVGDRTGNLFDVPSKPTYTSKATYNTTNTGLSITNTSDTDMGYINIDNTTLNFSVEDFVGKQYTLYWKPVAGGDVNFRINGTVLGASWGTSSETGHLTINIPLQYNSADVTAFGYRFSIQANTPSGTIINFDDIMSCEGAYNPDLPYEPYGHKLLITQSAGDESTEYNLYTDGELLSRESVNLLNPLSLSPTNANTTISHENGFMVLTASTDATGYVQTAFFDIPAGTYTAQLFGDLYGTVYIRKSVTEYTNSMTNTNRTRTFTFDEATQIQVLISLRAMTTSTIRIMLNEGDTATSYEPFGETVPDTAMYNPTSRTATVTRHCSVVDGEVVYAEPVTTDISDMQDWDSIPLLSKGTNVIAVGTEVEPSDITATYYSDKSEVN